MSPVRRRAAFAKYTIESDSVLRASVSYIAICDILPNSEVCAHSFSQIDRFNRCYEPVTVVMRF